MRCKACDKLMSEYEARRQDKLTGTYTDLCGLCYSESNKTISDYETTVDISVDFGGDDVYDLKEGYRVAYDEE